MNRRRFLAVARSLRHLRSKLVVIMCHIPLATAVLQLVPEWRPVGRTIVVENSAEVAALLESIPSSSVLHGHTLNEGMGCRMTRQLHRLLSVLKGSPYKSPLLVAKT
jgi:hypothetical protein